jgi:exopolyphosphatase / guanosine-5'-triphosphate,3'-diphosphate pyrophosphatase
MAEHVALLDFGSNAVRFVHARLARGDVEFLHEGRVRARLASGPHGSLSAPAIEQTLRAAGRFLRSVKAYEPRLLAVGTASVRDAPNARALLDRLPGLGVERLRILSGIEEATLGAESALRSLGLRTGAVIDLGGGSLQWTTVRNGKLKHGLSLPLGAARMTREFIRHDPPEPRDVLRLQEAVRAQLAQALPVVRPKGELIALGGTARALARRKLRVAGDRPKKRRAATLTLAELQRIRARLEVLTSDERKLLRGMRPHRADIVVAGALVLELLMKQSGYAQLTVCRASVREGVLWREAQRGTRRKTARNLATED